MRQLTTLAMALAVLAALLAGCGGGEEAGVLAVAFRLDEGSPLMKAYTGDPAEDSFRLPAGRYHIEALDQDEVFLSLGAVDLEDGEAVDLPSDFAEAGGVADPGRVEPLVTVANFLVDVELAEYAFLEIATGGFELPPFDPGVEPGPAEIEALYQRYAELASQEDALRSALSQIEAGATVSSGAEYVRSRWAPPLTPWDFFKKKADEWLFGGDSFLGWMKRATGEGQRERILAIAEQIPEGEREQVFKDTPVRLTGDAYDFDSWMEEVRQGRLDDELAVIYGQLYSADPNAARNAGQRPIDVLAREGTEGLNKGVEFEVEAYKKVPGFGKALELVGKTKEWDEYARKLAENWPAALEGTAREKYEEMIADKIKEDLKERAADLPQFTDEVIDKFADYFAKKAVAAVPQIVPTRVPTVEAKETAAATPVFTPVRTATATAAAVSPTSEETATPAPDTGWIEGYVQGIADQWLAAGYGGIDVAVAADDLRQCLIDKAQGGVGRDEAIGECPLWLYEPKVTPSPTQAPTPYATATSLPGETQTPAPEPTEPPTPEPTATPSPLGQQVTARGQLTDLYDPSKITANSITLRFNTQGGSVTGEGHVERTSSGGCRTADDQWIDGIIVWTWDVVFSGTYSRDTGQLDGTAQIAFRHVTCQRGAAWSEPWSATLQGSQVVGRFIEDCEWVASLYEWPTSTPECLPGAQDKFQLTVQGQ